MGVSSLFSNIFNTFYGKTKVLIHLKLLPVGRDLFTLFLGQWFFEHHLITSVHPGITVIAP